MSYVLVLNGDYRPINVCSIPRAVVLLLKEKAEIIERTDRVLHSETFSLDHPSVIRLVAYVRIPYETKRRITRRAILARDSWTCQYCGSETRLTIDHVVPRARGGEHVWENVVTACSTCNHRKGHGLLGEAGMRLRRPPTRPRPDVFLISTTRKVPAIWKEYLLRE